MGGTKLFFFYQKEGAHVTHKVRRRGNKSEACAAARQLAPFLPSFPEKAEEREAETGSLLGVEPEGGGGQRQDSAGAPRALRAWKHARETRPTPPPRRGREGKRGGRGKWRGEKDYTGLAPSRELDPALSKDASSAAALLLLASAASMDREERAVEVTLGSSTSPPAPAPAPAPVEKPAKKARTLLLPALLLLTLPACGL